MIPKTLSVAGRCLLLLVLSLVAYQMSGSLAFGQSATATLSGTVTDQNEAVVPSVDIAVLNPATSLERSAKTRDDGYFTVPLLLPGTYTVTARGQGFAPVRLENVVLNVGDQKSLRIQLKTSGVEATVQVITEAPLINESAAVSTVIDQRYVANMPLNGRSFQDLILLTPGVVSQSPTGRTGAGLGLTGEFSVNGQRTESNSYMVDGVSANVGVSTGEGLTSWFGASGSLPAATALGTTHALVSVDSLQEFRVQTSSYSAEYGRYPGAQLAFDTKSGTNQLHGSAFDYLRNGVFDANDWFNNYFGQERLAVRQNDFGGTVGGPVHIPRLYDGHDKSFFFASYEGLRLVSPQPANISDVPNLALRSSASGLVAQVLNAFPMPTSSGINDATNGFAQFIGSWANPSSLDSLSVRFDHSPSDKLRLFFRFSNVQSDSATRQELAKSVQTISAYALRTYTLGTSSAFSPRLNNLFRLNYTSNDATTSNVITALGGNTPVELRRLAGLTTPSGRAAVFFLYGGYFVRLSEDQNTGSQRQWNLKDTLDLAVGYHQLTFGVDYRRLTPYAVTTNPSLSWVFRSPENVIANIASDRVSVFGPAYPLYTNFSAFGQDEWQVSKRLKLSLGLRWDVNPAPGVTQGLKPFTVQGSSPATWSLAPEGTPLWATTWYNFAPRLGAVYLLRNSPGREIVVRGGGGVFFDTGQQMGSLGFSGAGFAASATPITGPFPNAPAIPAIALPPEPYTYAGYGYSPHLQLPYTIQWNASVEQGLGVSQALTLSYVGSHASRLLQYGLFQPTDNPNTNGFVFIRNRLTSDYHSLQAHFVRRLSQGLTALASYTWSHCLDFGSAAWDWEMQRGNCDFDVRHNLSTAFSYDVPNVGQSGFAKAALHHWGIDNRFTARSAFPIALLGDWLLLPNEQVAYTGLNIVPGQPISLHGADCDATLQALGTLPPGRGCPGGRALNPLAFAPASSGYGNAPRNFAQLFGAWEMSLAIRREFSLHEGLKLQFRAEAFNVFNHPNFGAVDQYFGSSTFGQATATLANSLSSLAPLYQQGGPRSMQFALKLLF